MLYIFALSVLTSSMSPIVISSICHLYPGIPSAAPLYSLVSLVSLALTWMALSSPRPVYVSFFASVVPCTVPFSAVVGLFLCYFSTASMYVEPVMLSAFPGGGYLSKSSISLPLYYYKIRYLYWCSFRAIYSTLPMTESGVGKLVKLRKKIFLSI